MADREEAPYAGCAAVDAQQVRGRILQLEKSKRPPQVRGARIRLMLKVLHAIASGSAEDPSSIASAVLIGLDRGNFLQRRGAKIQRPGNKRGKKIKSREERNLHFREREKSSKKIDVFQEAEKLSGRFAIDSSVLAFLHKNSRWTHLPRSDWEKYVRKACAIDRIMQAHFRGPLIGRLGDLIDQDAATEAFGKLKPSEATLLLSFHGAFLMLARKLFYTTFENDEILGRGGTITASEDSGTALFTALRALQDGRRVLIAPDGPEGSQAASVEILELTSHIADGAAFLAHTASCSTAWYTVICEDNKFKPILELGPRRDTGEKLEEFASRLSRFYAEKIEGVFTGDPRSITLRPRWLEVFKESSI